MNKESNARLVAALVCGMVVADASALTVTTISHVSRLSSATDGAEQISGVTYAGGNLFYAVDDDDNKLYPLTLAINRSSGALDSSGITIGAGVVLSGGNDMEGCAFDPCSGKVWVSQETSALIKEYDPSAGTLLRSAPVPAIQKKYRGNYSLEALTISGDGMTMWTANEEALTVDGQLATNSVGSVVRLTRFTRDSVRDNWTPAGEWAYETQPIGTAKDSSTRSGVSGLCALPDGTLLVLERRCYQGGLFPDFNIRIYQVNFSGATDVSSLSALDGASYTKTTKTMLWQYTDGSDMPNYEGICLGPRLEDGSSTLVLISDGGSYAEEGIFVLKLSGQNIRTMEFEPPSAGESSIVGAPYRFVNGATVNVALDGVQTPATAYTNNNTTCTDVGWEVTGGQSPASGTGPLASFTVAADGVFRWKVLSTTVAHTPIVGADSFEEYAAGAQAGDIAGWSGEDVEVLATNYSYSAAAGYPMALAEHTKVLSVDGEATRSYGGNVTNANQTLDLMVTVRRSADVLESPTNGTDTCQTAITADKDGYLNVFTSSGWERLSGAPAYENGMWVRLSVSFDYATHKAKISVDGTACGAYDLLDQAAKSVSELSVIGTCNVDDVILSVDDDAGYTPASTITVADAAEFERVKDGIKVTAAPEGDSAVQSLFSAQPALLSRYCALFRPVLGADGRTVSFVLTDAAEAGITNALATAVSGVDLSAVAAGTDVSVGIATEPGLYYTLKAGAELGGMEVDQCVLGDGTSKEFTFRKQQDDSGFYTVEITLERQQPASTP